MLRKIHVLLYFQQKLSQMIENTIIPSLAIANALFFKSVATHGFSWIVTEKSSLEADRHL